MFDINQFSAEINRRGMSKTANFKVQCFSPVGMTDVARSMTYRIKSVDQPGRSVTMMENSYYGPMSHIATGSQMVEMNIGIIMSENQQEREYFEAWMDLILGPYRNGVHDETSYDVGFFEDYKGSFTIINYDDMGFAVRETNLIDAFPSNIGNVAMDWDNGNEIAILPVTITFKKYESKRY